MVVIKEVLHFYLIPLITIILSFVISDVLAADDSVLAKHKDCVDRAKKSSKLISNRFNDPQIAAICDRQFQWTKTIFHLSDVETSNFLTTNQRKWLNSVYACANLRLCQCDDFVCYPLHKKKRAVDGLPYRNDKLLLRKEYRMLTDDERDRFHGAMNALKSDLIDNYSKYDLLTSAHTPNQAPGAHFGPAFLPWHREYLRQFETALRFYDDSVAIPYWDSTLEQGLPDPRHSVIWSKKFFGNGDDMVNEGPFANWTVPISAGVQPTDHLSRHIANSPYGSLFKNSDVAALLARRKFNELAGCTDQFFEMMHGTVHLWIGGTMADIPLSPSDPVFHLHHAFVDQIWQKFRDTKQTRRRRETEYPNQNASCNAYHYADAQMLPFQLKNIDGLSNKYNDEIYIYESRPACSRSKPDCGSPYLFCDTITFICLSKIVPGGNCTGLESLSTSPCIDGGRCTLGRCHNLANALAPPGPPAAPDMASTVSASSTFSYQGPTRYGSRTLTLTTADTCSCNCEGNEDHETTDAELSNEVQPLSTNNRSSIRWIALAVLKVNLSSGFYVGAPGAEVKLQTSDSTHDYSTTVSSKTEYPYYSGVAVVKIDFDPSLQNSTIDINFVVSLENTSCSCYCYDDQKITYVACSSLFTFDIQSGKLNDSIDTFASENQSLRDQWYHGSRIPPKLISVCDETTSVSTNMNHSCRFLKFESSTLVGFARQVLDNVHLTTCKSFCQRSIEDFGFNCTSLTFLRNENIDQTKDLINLDSSSNNPRGTCALNSESRITKPHLFVEQPQSIYMDMICGDYSVSLE